MIVEAVMDELGERLSLIENLNVHPYEADKISPPAALISLPTQIDYDRTYIRGMDQLDLIVTILVSRVGAKVRRDKVAPYSDGSGPRSLKSILEKGPNRSFDEITVRTGAFDIINLAKVDYLGFMASCRIIGQGD